MVDGSVGQPLPELPETTAKAIVEERGEVGGLAFVVRAELPVLDEEPADLGVVLESPEPFVRDRSDEVDALGDRALRGGEAPRDCRL